MASMRATIELMDKSNSAIDFGLIQSIRMVYTSSLQSMPVILWGYKGTYCMDLGVTMSITFEFTRVNPVIVNDSSSDSRYWSNSRWKQKVKEQFGGWLSKDGGCKLKIISSDTTLFPSFDDGSATGHYPAFIGYMTMMPTTTSSKKIGVISGTITFDIGKMKQIATSQPAIPSYTPPSSGRFAYLKYGNTNVELGLINDISDTLSIQNNCSLCKMPMLRAEDQFGMDTGTVNTLVVSTTRFNPASGTNNTRWMMSMISAINRWQSETNGCIFRFNPDSSLSQHLCSYNENVYLSQMSFTYDTTSPEIISARIGMTVGSMTGPVQYENNQPVQNMEISMTDADDVLRSISYYENGEYKSCVTSMRVIGGFNQPFESLELEIPIRLLEMVQSVFKNENSICAGSTRIHLNGAMGEGDFIVTSTKSKDNMLTITALTIWELFKSMTLPEDIDCRPRKTGSETIQNYSMIHPTYGISGNDDGDSILIGLIGILIGQSTPDWFKDYYNIHGDYGVRFHDVKYVPTLSGYGHRVNDVQSWGVLLESLHPVEEKVFPIFRKGQNVWYVMQVCALCVGAVIGFSGNTMYLESFDSYSTSRLRALAIANDEYIDSSSWYIPDAPSTPTGWEGEYVGPGIPSGNQAYYKNIKSKITGIPKIGSSQPNDVRNIFTFTYGIQNINSSGEDVGVYKEVIIKDRVDDNYAELSRSRFGEKSDVKSLIGIGSKDTAKFAGNALIWHYAWSVAPITVSVLESTEDTWAPYFNYVENFVSIMDAINNVSITRVEDESYIPIIKLTKYVRHYPQCITEYTFGTLSPTSLSQSLSQISQAIKSGKR